MSGWLVTTAQGVEEVDHESHLLVDAHPQLGRQVRRVAQGDEAIICGTFAQT